MLFFLSIFDVAFKIGFIVTASASNRGEESGGQEANPEQTSKSSDYLPSYEQAMSGHKDVANLEKFTVTSYNGESGHP